VPALSYTRGVSDPNPPSVGDVTTAGTSIQSKSIGDAWLSICDLIMRRGVAGHYDGLAMREVIMATLCIAEPRVNDDVIHQYADSGRMAWMHDNFSDHSVVEALGNADSYATRLRDYAHSGRDQITWVSQRLLGDPTTRSATIATFQPLSDTSYIPCVSLLDFYLIDGKLELAIYAHSIDFGAKGFANLVELASLQEEVPSNVGAPVGSLTMIIKSAHIYDSDVEYMRGVLSSRQ
jgi:thymidylate synthase